jgi:uncharacterized protein YbjT (DUF2867 family)
MPALITGAHRPLARRIASALLTAGGEVRVHGRGDVSLLRAAGAIAAPGDGDDEGHLEASLEQVHTAVHVGRGVLAPAPEILVAEAITLARAAAGAGVQRVIALSIPGAAPDADDPLRAAMGEVERILAAGPVPSVVLRTSLIDTPAMRDGLATAGIADRTRETRVDPVRPDDVVELVAAFDDLRGSAPRGHFTFLADGPTALTVAGYLDRVGVARVGSGSLVGRRVLDPARVPMLLPSLGAPWVATDAERAVLPDAWSFTGLNQGALQPG